MSEQLKHQVFEALEQVCDPCSVATRSPLSIVDMGLVRRVAVNDDSDVEVAISPTAPSCVLIAAIIEAATDEIRAIEGVGSVSVVIDSEFFWTPEAMTQSGQTLLARYRSEHMEHAPKPLGLRRDRREHVAVSRSSSGAPPSTR